MKYEIKREDPEYKPISIKITCETETELVHFYSNVLPVLSVNGKMLDLGQMSNHITEVWDGKAESADGKF